MEQSTSQSKTNLAYHYTSIGVFLKLIEEIKDNKFFFHASYFDAQNDPSEFKYGYEVFLNALKKLEDKRGIEDKYKLTTIAMEDNMSVTDWNEVFIDYHSTMFHLPFVISFSNDKDNLSLWRSYGSNGNGVALGFDRKAAGVRNCVLDEKDFPNSMPYAVDVSYGEMNDVLKEVLNRHYDVYQKCVMKKKDDDLLAFKTNYLYYLCRFLVSLTKHKAYEEEKETRMVFFKNEKQEEYLFKVNRNERLVPYIQVPIPQSSLKRIVLGPCCTSTKRDVEMLLKNKGFEITQDIVVKSVIPYRDI